MDIGEDEECRGWFTRGRGVELVASRNQSSPQSPGLSSHIF